MHPIDVKGDFVNHQPLFYQGVGISMIVQQIYRTLKAVEAEGHDIKYVFFAEHDCLYPEEHFVVEDFDEDVMFNSNHIGFTNRGFQKNQAVNTCPTFSMVMKFDFALSYFKNRLLCMFEHPSKYAVVEPLTHFNNLEEWTSYCKSGLTASHCTRSTQNPILHMWTNAHTTSHFNTYPKDEFLSYNDYWGDWHTLANSFYGQWIEDIKDISEV